MPIFPTLSGCGHTLSGDRHFPLFDRRASHWANARSALWQGLCVLGLQAGDRVLAPVYACGSEIDVLVRFGLHVDWYAVHADRTVDLDDAKRRCKSNTKAFLFIHYFGIPQPTKEISEFCRTQRLASIEDNAHGLFSKTADQQPLGSFGDIAVFSIYKTLPVPDGGILVINSDELRGSARPVGPPIRQVLGKSKLLIDRCIDRSDSVMAVLLRRGIVNPLAWAAKKLQPAHISMEESASTSIAQDGSTHSFDVATRDHGMSKLARLMLRAFDQRLIVERRRQNFARLLQSIDKGGALQPVITVLADGACPLFFPMQKRPGDRGFRRFMRQNGVECHGFGFPNPALPAAGFELELTLKQDIVCLPVHQSLGDTEVDMIAALVNDWNSRVS